MQEGFIQHVLGYIFLFFRDPFERSMSLWIMNEYVFSVETFLEEANDPKRIKDREIKMERTNSDDTLVFTLLYFLIIFI